MYIKKIIIQGFKTYKNATTVDLLSPHCNVVVGRNGSGKSNFFAAIRFVLSDAYTHMSREERQGLIHESSGTVISAYVEIIFDNSDGRFPINKREISIRRTIGLKKDDYSLDGKSVTRSDIMNLLESAGFSRSNPYYIVPQGRITSLTNSKEHERLNLLKEVSGATVFENKLKESMKEMEQSNTKRARIDETLVSIEERLKDLQIESADLENFQKLDKQKKALEFNIFDRELNELNESLEELDEKNQDMKDQSKQDLIELENREKLCVELQDTINELKISLKVLSLEKEQSNLDCDQLLKIIAEKEIKLNEFKYNNDTSNEQNVYIDEQIKTIQAEVARHKQEIAQNRPKLVKLQEQEAGLKQRLLETTSKQRALYSKQSRFQQFPSKKDRDHWLNDEISKLKKQITAKDQDIHHISNEIKTRETTLGELSESIDKLDASLNDEQHIKTLAELKTSTSELKSQINQLVDERKTLWRDEVRLKSVYDSLTNDLTNATNLVNQTMDRAQAQGIAAVKQIASRLNLTDHVYGTVAELFNVNDKYKTAAEVIAGNSLFHVVVDTDATAASIMEELVRSKTGRVTFVPLNRIDSNHIEYPDSHEFQCIPLIEKLKYNDSVSKAMNQVFGKALVVSDLAKGGELARRFKLNCITLDGDRVDIKGVLSGGYRDYKNSRIDALKIQAKKKKDLEKTQTELNKTTEEIENANVQLTKLNNELQLNVRDLDRLADAKEPIKIELSQLNNKKFNLGQELASLKFNLNNLQSTKNAININLKQHEQELNSEFTQILSDDEQTQLNKLNQEVTQLESQLDKVVTQSSTLDTKLSQYESELINNYQPRLNKYRQEQIRLGNKVENSLEIEELQAELDNLQIQLDTAQSRNTHAIDTYNKTNQEIQKCEEELNKANQQQIKIVKNLEKNSKHVNALANQKSIKEQMKNEAKQKIRDLGALPEGSFESEVFDKLSSKDLLEKLNTVNQELTKYSHINKKAMDQFNLFNKQRDDLVSRRVDLDKSRDSIEDLISNLQQQKNDAIKKSFQQVAKSFTEVFEKLVPRGIGKLIMQKKDETNDSDDIDNYSGVAISVSFNSKNDEQQRIEQLSGGQKSLCAIALIFAIQNCDPAPFYLFDEIDSNLDTQYRTSVANLIKELSSEAQFICTTFRPELLQLAADKFYGVTFSNKVSSINEINKEEAMSFVEGQQHR
ncbi:sudA Chromosome segregation protein sudA [Candida maltosa Xu316]|uniref:Structural maintenance of chromosomes protein n=1 Tax=Candida maltosa (strain Xu316) TaxID=1245528 RepID=M3J5A0_CANMX|nr:Structural maintenance of chromosome 3 [Candida maltosa Xu316]